ncbi:tRNA pseudouridine38-40 synthase [Maridesulfovibrio ferrireducens]|uniref:tRNA pseudouridine synthase A n=1 Tax=Maridesulfovibrio ferrireducens TaxID=246191 RepID=A0A1G9BGY8_9BACT|nr:tRNA pseudouridine(38-40) synthase TruA [Maridesulfovibrio ferrireducens]SDK38761.1 tRNA pseudouridine38-40 synthase [Maridesulfovibrio ferrireducens]
MKRIKITIAYDGTKFCGWQIQPGVRTVQNELEKAISRITGAPVRVYGSGRTDSGVHALGQVVHFTLPESRAEVPWQRALNAIMPDDVTVLDVAYVDESFHAQFSSIRKTYVYTLWLENKFLFPCRRNYVWGCGPLDIDALDTAMKYFLGEHDFASFQNVGTPVKNTIRTILEFVRLPGENEHEIKLQVCGTGFLKQMVRNMVGCLVDIGRGKAEPGFVRSVLEAKDRTLAPATAPPQGLCLSHVYYGEPKSGGPESGRNESRIDGTD